MGTKAKAAIQKAKAATAGLNGTVETLLLHFQGVIKEKKDRAQALAELARLASQDKYQNVADLTPFFQSDPELKQYGGLYNRHCQDVKVHKQACRAAIAQLKAEAKAAGDALQEIGKLVQEKASQRQSTSNPLKKVVARLKTRSLGELRAENATLKAAVHDMIDKTMGIVAYFDRSLADQGEIEQALHL